jgi:hypothetical protein
MFCFPFHAIKIFQTILWLNKHTSTLTAKTGSCLILQQWRVERTQEHDSHRPLLSKKSAKCSLAKMYEKLNWYYCGRFQRAPLIYVRFSIPLKNPTRALLLIIFSISKLFIVRISFSSALFNDPPRMSWTSKKVSGFDGLYLGMFRVRIEFGTCLV